MPNKKRKRIYYKENLGAFKITRRDILAFEDIIKKYTASYDEKTRKYYSLSTKKSERNDLNKDATFSDVYIEYTNSIFGGRGIKLGRWELSIIRGINYDHEADSIRDLPKGMKFRYLRIVGKPGMSLEFTPTKTILSAQRGNAKGTELEAMDLAIKRVKKVVLKK